ncbi:hypothetical protein [Polymorphobacter sp.]|uniref:hypothetical protein n=1 Tax=Polymorphobacter sp. TaxID=1909290 RepID=UPI003F726D5B
MFAGDLSAGPPGPPDTDSRLLVWCVRRLALTSGLQRCPAVEAALLRHFGARGQELSMLLRCLVHALALHCPRRLVLGHACHPALTADELRLLSAIRTATPTNLGPSTILTPLLTALKTHLPGSGA